MKTPRFPGFPEEALKFLRALKRNNNRDWFLAHKETYEEAVKKPMQALIQALAEDFAIFAPELLASSKTSMYRIYRDTRFSKDKTPYKTHASALFFRRDMEKHRGAGLYLHIAPEEFFVGGGMYRPMPEDIRAVRVHIAENPKEFRSIVEGKAFKKVFGELQGESLSRVPRGFPVDHPMAEYLKRQQHLAARTFGPEVATTEECYPSIVETFRAIVPLIRFLNDPIVLASQIAERRTALLR